MMKRRSAPGIGSLAISLSRARQSFQFQRAGRIERRTAFGYHSSSARELRAVEFFVQLANLNPFAFENFLGLL